MIYNVKTIEYADSIQVRTYKRPVRTSNKITLPSKDKPKVKREEHERTKAQIEHSIQSSVNRTINQIYTISRSNHWEYFVTLTIDPKKLNSRDFNLVSEKLNIWTNNLKKRYAPDLKYLLVPELHGDKEKWHFHGFFSNIGKMPLTFSGKTCIGKFVYDYVKKPYATKIYNVPLWKYGYSTVTEVKDNARASSYITKYITKDVTKILEGQHRYLASQNVDKPIEKVFNVDYETLGKIYSQYLSQVNYISDVELPNAHQEIIYMEFNKNVDTDEQTPVNYEIFKVKEPETTVENIAEKPKEEPYEATIKPHFTGKKRNSKEYLKQLLNLKQFLKENPDMRYLYADVNLEHQIKNMRQRIFREERLKYVDSRQIPDGFNFTTENPFS